MTKIFKAKVVDGEKHLEGIKVILACRNTDGSTTRIPETSDSHGHVEFLYSGVPFSIYLDSSMYWTTEIENPRSGVTIRTTRVRTGIGPTAWWHEEVADGMYEPAAGRGIKVGVIDTGLGKHATLNGFSYHEIQENSNGNIIVAAASKRSDPANHGTQVCGLIGSRPPDGSENNHYCGIAPGAELFCVGICNDLSEENDAVMPEMEIIEALHFLVKEQLCDLVNISLTGPPRGKAKNLENQVEYAYKRGCLVICAAGNEGALPPQHNSNVCPPGNSPYAIAVSALGKEGVGPECEPSPLRDGGHSSAAGYYLAKFSSRGKEIFCGAPGVAVVAPVDRDLEIRYSFVEGTSFSAPLVCGALAVRLSRTDDYLRMPRDMGRADRAKNVLKSMCREIGLRREFCGFGLPKTTHG